MKTLYVQKWKKWLRIWVLGFVVIYTVFASQIISYANSPAPAGSFTIYGRNVPEKTERLELLIPIGEDDPAYLSCNEIFEALTGLSPDSEIATYVDSDGYVSYCAHMKGATCKTWERELGDGRMEQVFDFGINGSVDGHSHLEYIQKNFGTIKVAALDENGTVLQVSSEAQIAPKKNRGYLTSGLHFDGATGELQAHIFGGYSIFSILGALLSSLFWLLLRPGGLVFHVVLTVVVECVTAYFFGIRRLTMVAKVNMSSNLLFNLLMQFSVGSYFSRMIFLEFVVVLGEYQIYRKLFATEEIKHLKAFVLVANGVSLVCGLLTAVIG